MLSGSPTGSGELLEVRQSWGDVPTQFMTVRVPSPAPSSMARSSIDMAILASSVLTSASPRPGLRKRAGLKIPGRRVVVTSPTRTHKFPILATPESDRPGSVSPSRTLRATPTGEGSECSSRRLPPEAPPSPSASDSVVQEAPPHSMSTRYCETPPQQRAAAATTVELIPHSPGVTAAIFVEAPTPTPQRSSRRGSASPDASQRSMQGAPPPSLPDWGAEEDCCPAGSPERLAYHSDGAFFDPIRLPGVLSSLQALEAADVPPGYRQGESASDSAFRKENARLEEDVQRARDRLADLEAQLKEKQRSRSTSLRKLRSAALMLGMGVMAKRRSVSHRGSLPPGSGGVVPAPSAQVVLQSEELRREVFVDDILEPKRHVRPRDPDVMRYSIMHRCDRGKNRFFKLEADRKRQREREAAKQRIVDAARQSAADGSAGGGDPAALFDVKSDAGASELEGTQVLEKGKAEAVCVDAVEEAMSSPVSSGAQLAKIMDEVFDLIDTNNDGNIDIHEVKAFTDTFPDPPPESKLNTLFRVADRDGSKTIEKDEFLSLLRLLEGTLKIPATKMMDNFRQRCIARLFDFLDVDGDGALSINEVRSLVRTLQHDCAQVGDLRKVNIKLNHTNEEINQMFRQVDVDNSGELDKEEFVKFIKTIVGDVPVSRVTSAFLKGRQVAEERMRLKKLWFS